MAVHCASCGGELFGAVNRCWHCRRSFAKPPSQDGRPAVRRAPVIVEGMTKPMDAVVIGDPPARPQKAQEKPGITAALDSADANLKPAVGSPFSPGWTMPRVERGRAAAPAAAPPAEDDPDELGRWGALIGFVCGSGGLIASAYYPLPIMAAWIGLTMGTLGLKNYRLLAMAGLFLCCLLLTVQGLFLMWQLYIQAFKASPWDAVFAQ